MHRTLRLPQPDASKVEMAMLKFDGDLSGGLNQDQFTCWFSDFVKQRSASFGTLPGLDEFRNGSKNSNSGSLAQPKATVSFGEDKSRGPTLLRQE